MIDKPSYLGLLNALAVAESRSHRYFAAWAEKTTDPDVKALLVTVSLREGEHAMMFAKRIDELGFAVREKPDSFAEEALIVACSDLSDLDKLGRICRLLTRICARVCQYFDRGWGKDMIEPRGQTHLMSAWVRIPTKDCGNCLVHRNTAFARFSYPSSRPISSCRLTRAPMSCASP